MRRARPGPILGRGRPDVRVPLQFPDMTGGRRPSPFRILPDGTIKQRNPYTGTEVWTVPGRGDRPLRVDAVPADPIDPAESGRHCAFCEGRLLETPPEKARVVRAGNPDAGAAAVGEDLPGADAGWRLLRGLPASALDGTTAEYRRIPNLFAIVDHAYWRENHGFQVDAVARARIDAYVSDPDGARHVVETVRRRCGDRYSGAASPADFTETERLIADGFFAGGHDVIVARRHFGDDATTADALASAGTSTPAGHRAFVALTVDAAADLLDSIPAARRVVVFQNWLRPAGASFDHLHKQIVAIDERGPRMEVEIAALEREPELYNVAGVDVAAREGLLVAENAHAVVVAGVGHRFPTLVVYSKSATPEPWLQTPGEIAAMSDLLHACHAATGPGIPCNEEWHFRPRDLALPMPWRIALKWRVSTPAGFEGGTRIHLTTLSPWDLRGRVVERLRALREEGRIAAGISIGAECRGGAGMLAYARGG